MSGIDERINVLYGDASLSPGDSPAASPTPGEEQPEPPPGEKNPYMLEGDRAAVLYADSNRVNLGDIDTTLVADAQQADPETVKSNMSYIAGETGATQQDVAALTEVCGEYASSPVTDTEARETAFEVGMAELRQQYGGELSNKLTAARQLVASFPDLHAYLDSTGAGNDPRVIAKVMAIADGPKAQERLQQLLKRSKK